MSWRCSAGTRMIAGLHCHYPMHLLGEDHPPSTTYDHIVRVRRRPRWLERLRALVLRIAARLLIYRDDASTGALTSTGSSGRAPGSCRRWRPGRRDRQRARAAVSSRCDADRATRRGHRSDPRAPPAAGRPPDGDGIARTVATVSAHIDRIHEITGAHAFVRSGSDLDGFSKPAMSAIEASDDLATLQAPLRDADPADAAAPFRQRRAPRAGSAPRLSAAVTASCTDIRRACPTRCRSPR